MSRAEEKHPHLTHALHEPYNNMEYPDLFPILWILNSLMM